jgi:hypothetical protein
VTRRYEEVRHTAIFAGQTFRAELRYSGIQLFGGFGPVPNCAASRPLRLHCGSVPAVDVQPPYKEERTRQMDQ